MTTVKAAVGEVVRGVLESLLGSDADVAELAGFSTHPGAVGGSIDGTVTHRGPQRDVLYITFRDGSLWFDVRHLANVAVGEQT
ncbi:hypothetical protein DIPPA_27142 [Diplonema papillatum]|nr:hypothetical protein DIPPA_27142 [Diplonema papillatum]